MQTTMARTRDWTGSGTTTRGTVQMYSVAELGGFVSSFSSPSGSVLASISLLRVLGHLDVARGEDVQLPDVVAGLVLLPAVVAGG